MGISDLCRGKGRSWGDEEERMTEEAGRWFRSGRVAVSADVSDCSMWTSERMWDRRALLLPVDDG